MKIILPIAFLLGAGFALAEVDQDNICVVFDHPGGCRVNCLPPGVTVPAECLNIAQFPGFAVGCRTPFPISPCTPLLVLHLMVFWGECWCFGVSPYQTAIGGNLDYLDTDGDGLFIPMTPCAGSAWEQCKMAWINCDDCPPDPPLDPSSLTWTGLKILYR